LSATTVLGWSVRSGDALQVTNHAPHVGRDEQQRDVDRGHASFPFLFLRAKVMLGDAG
jgi:hypothetical protein